MGKDDFKYLIQGLDREVLDLLQQKRFLRYEYMSGFEEFKENFQVNKSFIAH